MIKGLIITSKRGKIGWNEGRERFQFSAAYIELRFLGNIYVWHG